MGINQFLIPRLDGESIERDFKRHLDLVKEGVAGFIVFGGEVSALREGLRRLQKAAELPLIFASDLEQGLGQQVRGGTLLPPAMAIAKVAEKSPALVERAFTQIAREAAFTGINTVLAPVLDINTNPGNPIISTRAYGEEPGTVSLMGGTFIRCMKREGLVSCGKHYPGHGDTMLDSHVALPVLDKSLDELEKCELVPFREAIKAGVEMIMPGHLSVPVLEPSGAPMTVSERAIDYLRIDLGFGGIVISDALNMGGLAGYDPEDVASKALNAGIDLLLHPEEPEMLIKSLSARSFDATARRVVEFRKRLSSFSSHEKILPDPEIASELSRLCIRIEGLEKPLKNPLVITLSDDEDEDGGELVNDLRKCFPSLTHTHLKPGEAAAGIKCPQGVEIIVAVFSSIRAWKSGASAWIMEQVGALRESAHAFVSFGPPYLLDSAEGKPRIFAYWRGKEAQKAVAALLSESE